MAATKDQPKSIEDLRHPGVSPVKLEALIRRHQTEQTLLRAMDERDVYRHLKKGWLRGAQKAAQARGPGPEKIRAEYERQRRRNPRAPHKAVCAATARQLNVSDSRVRHVVPSPG